MITFVIITYYLMLSNIIKLLFDLFEYKKFSIISLLYYDNKELDDLIDFIINKY